MPARLEIEASVCSAHGLCYATAPALVGVDDDGYPVPTGAALDVRPDDEALAAEVAVNCPEAAITLVRG